MVLDNTLFIGNGFSMSMFEGIPSWKSLFPDISAVLMKSNATLLYEIYRKEKQSEIGKEDEFKREFLNKINGPFEGDNVQSRSDEVELFGQMLMDHKVHNIITTNYDGGIEWILTKKCGYKQEIPLDLVPEEIYSIRTYKMYRNEDSGHTVKLWKIHGDGEPNEQNRRIKSVTLGFDQYCGAIAKEYAYIKGEYDPNVKHGKKQEPTNKPTCTASLAKKCCNPSLFDGISWIELFFTTNMYFIGFGMNFSEIDIWWLLNQHSRLREWYPTKVTSRITVLNTDQYGLDDDIKEMLRRFDVDIQEILSMDSDSRYLSNIFNAITNT